MKFRFKIQQYQTDAVNAIADVFKGQPYQAYAKYTMDMGVAPQKQTTAQIDMFGGVKGGMRLYNDDEFDVGFANPRIELSPDTLLTNIQNIQSLSNINESRTLSRNFGAVDLDVEMETGTGKTYVYIKSMFELNKRYGFSKFIVVVPSIAIREGVKKSFEMTQDHFMDTYGKKARFFIYDSKKLDQIEQFSSSNAINVMIINIQAFNSRGADARRIYEELDEFQSRRPIDVIAKNRPIIILDEPQKMGGAATQESLQRFNPLFSMNFSATHKITHNAVYVLDALDAFNKKLVKKIQVKGFTIRNLRGTNGYLYLQDIVLSPNKPPMAKIELEVAYNSGTKREVRPFKVGDNIYQASKEMEQYKNGYVINEINPFNNTVSFINGDILQLGVAAGDVSENDIRRIQIRETIRSHFEKEEELYYKGIKVLSLFFIDEVAKYRQYDEDGNEVNGLYGKIFEEEYLKIVNEYITLFDTPYVRYLQNATASQVHRGYFSIDKKGRKVDSSVGRGTDISDDVSAYDLILKDKERLLSFEEPTRFIFSHSALREGWDNPNVFQICTLKHSSSNIQRRQEVGRGLRLCVNSLGERMDATIPNFDVHSINKLTVIANDSYEDFVRGLQAELKENLYERPSKASKEFFAGKKVIVGGEEMVISSQQATAIYRYLLKNDYVDDTDKPTDTYKNAVKEGTLAPLPMEIEPMADVVHKLVQSTYDADALKGMFENGNQAKVQDNKLNDNFYKKEFQKLWALINHKYAYTVEFDSEELIKKAIESIDKNLYVGKLTYTVSTGEQKDQIDAEEVKNAMSFKGAKTKTDELRSAASDTIKYDLLGKVAGNTALTRKTVAAILKGIQEVQFMKYQVNPEDFINKVSKLINEQKATLIVEHVTYNEIEGGFEADIFTEAKLTSDFKNAYKAEKHIRDYVFVDGISKTDSIERRFAEDLDGADEVCVYAKLPKGFYIPTPVGNYSPDWAIAFKEGSVKHIYFIAETKGSLESLQMREVERAKIDCAKKLFNKMSTSTVRYENVTSYQDLLDKMNGLE